MKVIIAGSRTFADYQLLKTTCDLYMNRHDTVFSGMAPGADRLGKRYAVSNGMKLKLFPANWEGYGKLAGFKRNVDMAREADMLIAFWDGVSGGTKHMIKTAKSRELKVVVKIFSTTAPIKLK